MRIRIAIGEGVEPRAQNNVLLDPARDGIVQLIFRVTASRHHEGAHAACEGAVVLVQVICNLCCDICTENGHCNRVIEDQRSVIENLMRSTPSGYSVSGEAGASFLHETSSSVFQSKGIKDKNELQGRYKYVPLVSSTILRNK